MYGYYEKYGEKVVGIYLWEKKHFISHQSTRIHVMLGSRKPLSCLYGTKFCENVAIQTTCQHDILF